MSEKKKNNASDKAKKTVKKQVKRQAKKTVKKHKKGIIIFVVILLVIIIAAVALVYAFKPEIFTNLMSRRNGDDTDEETKTTQVLSGDEVEISGAELSVHFLELGVANVGDCVLIKSGNTEVLIDAGAKSASAPTAVMTEYIDKYCTDGTLEYVIATHAHEDHIAGLVGQVSGDSRTGIFYNYTIGTLIQFAGHNTDSKIYSNYETAVKKLEDDGTKVYTALQCWNESDGASKQYYLNDEKTVSINILYQKYYEEKASTENDYSVCMLLKHEISTGEFNNYLFTGDLEKSGETSLAESNDLPHCVLFKGGHHGSSTSSNDVLLKEITPDNIAICTCAGTYEYADKPTDEKPNNYLNTFPTQEAIERMSVYTENIYVTSLGILNEDYSTNSFTSMNGNIVFYTKDGSVKLWCSNNTTKLKDTEWFKANRTTPSAWVSG